MNILFADGIAEIFCDLPKSVQIEAARIIDLLAKHPKMYPVRRRGIMKGYRPLGCMVSCASSSLAHLARDDCRDTKVQGSHRVVEEVTTDNKETL